MSLLAKLKRRKLVQWLLAYAAGAWVLLQVLSLLISAYHWPDSVLRIGIVVAVIGFLVTLVLAWYHGERGEQRLGRTEGLLLLSLVAIGGGLAWRTAHAPVPTAVVASAAPAAAAITADPRSIAVLPFVNMSSDPAQEFFSDGIAEELLNHLAQYSNLRVAARTSAFQFKGKALDIADIGRQLNVSHVLEGSVRKQGARIRITAQLIDAVSGFHLWSETYERDASDVFKVQDEISTAIASALEATISSSATATLPARSTNPDAYNDYLQGRAFIAKRVGDNPKLAVAAFDRSIARDPGNSQAHSGRAFAMMVATHWQPWLPITEHNRQAVASAEQALRLDPNNAEAYMVRGLIELTQYRIVAARADLEHAYALAPGSVDVLNFYGDFLGETGDLRRAEAMKRQAMALDPLAFVHPMNLIVHMYSQRRFPEAIAFAQQALALGGGERITGDLFRVYMGTGDVDAAAKLLPDLCHAPEPSGACRYAKAALHAANGRRQEAAVEIAQWEVLATAEGRSLSASIYACVLGDYARAARAVLKDLDAVRPGATYVLSCDSKGAQLPEEMSQDPEWLAVWKDPRLAEYMQAYRTNIAKYRSGG